jgi:uncharacterized membrane protein
MERLRCDVLSGEHDSTTHTSTSPPAPDPDGDAMSWRPVTLGVAAVGSGLVGGVLFAFSSFVMPALRRIPPAQGISAMQSINRQAPTFAFMSIVGVTAIASAGAGIHAVLNRDEPGTAWVGVGTVAYIAALAITGGFNVPRNDRLATFDAATPAAADYWSTFLTEWVIGNHVRTACCIVAAASYTAALRIT